MHYARSTEVYCQLSIFFVTSPEDVNGSSSMCEYITLAHEMQHQLEKQSIYSTRTRSEHFAITPQEPTFRMFIF